MRTLVPEKLLMIVDEIDVEGFANLTRLTVLKKWFEHEGRLAAFGLWVARRSAGRKGKTKGEAGDLLNEARVLLGSTANRESYERPVDRQVVQDLYDRARELQNEYKRGAYGDIRIIHCWPLLLVEKGLALYLGRNTSPSDGYKLAADFCQHYDPKFGTCLNGPSRTKINEIVRFMFVLEAIEEDNART